MLTCLPICWKGAFWQLCEYFTLLGYFLPLSSNQMKRNGEKKTSAPDPEASENFEQGVA